MGNCHWTRAGRGFGLTKQGYGEFITWRACFRYWERTGSEDVKAFLTRTLTNPKVWKLTPERIAKGGLCADQYAQTHASNKAHNTAVYRPSVI